MPKALQNDCYATMGRNELSVFHATKPLHFISKGNVKTGCFSFDIPPRTTCPGRTEECSRDCYAFNMERVYAGVRNKWLRNAVYRTNSFWVADMIDTIPRGVQFRIHVSGDFDSVDYVKRWQRIALARPDVTFYAYTRSWRIVKLWPSLRALARIPNVTLNLSTDDETGPPRSAVMKGLRWCYLTKTDNVPSWIRSTDIVFRSSHNGQKRRIKNAIAKGNVPPPYVTRLGGVVCPKETGKDVPKLSCSKCKLCVEKVVDGVRSKVS